MNQPRAATPVLPVLDIEHARDRLRHDTPPGEILQQWHDAEGRVVASGGRSAPGWWMHWPRLGTYYFAAEGPVRAVPVSDGLDEALSDSFARGVAPVVMLARGHEALHASAVSSARGVVAFCAASGTGKSTIALAVAAAGLTLWADDTVVYRVSAGEPLAIRLPCPVRVDDRARRAIGGASIESDTAAQRPLARVYHLARDTSVDPRRPAFAAVPALERFNRLLSHAHPFDLADEARRRCFLESLLVASARVETFECRFAPSLAALPALARAIRAHLEETAA
jgi:hypothetical protein